MSLNGIEGMVQFIMDMEKWKRRYDSDEASTPELYKDTINEWLRASLSVAGKYYEMTEEAFETIVPTQLKQTNLFIIVLDAAAQVNLDEEGYRDFKYHLEVIKDIAEDPQRLMEFLDQCDEKVLH